MKKKKQRTSEESEKTQIVCFSQMHIFDDVPSNEVFLIADVLVVIRVLHNVGHVHNKVHKGLCLLAKEVQEVAEAAVFCDYKHRS